MLRAAQTTWKTDTGRQRRENEDSAYARAPLFVVADGMGGAQAGEVASRIAVEAFQAELPPGDSPEARLAGCAQAANRQIYEISRSEHERAGMGTTLTAVYVGDGDLAVAHVGDSRAYRFRDGELHRLTQDHSLVEELVRRGKLTEEQAAEHPQRSIITRALGIDPEVEVDTWTYPARAGDVVLLCSDGLTSMISEELIASVLGVESDLDLAGERLIAEANEAGGRDNITVILVRLEDAGAGTTDQPTVVGLEREAGSDAGRDAGADSDDSGPRADRGAPGFGSGACARALATTTAGATLTAPARPALPPGSRPPQARSELSPRTPSRARAQGRGGSTRRRRRSGRFAKPVAAVLTVGILLFLIGGGGYLASRQLFFIGTNPQGIVTVYRGLPYDLWLGVRLYEQVYVSGVPAGTIPAARRMTLLNHHLRSQRDAISLVHAAELGQLTK